MTRTTTRTSLLAMVVGMTMLRLAIGGHHRNYVRAAMGSWLVVSGIVLLALGGVVLLMELTRDRSAGGHRDHGEHAGHEGHADHADHAAHEGHVDHAGHRHGSRVGWLLLAPVLVLFLVGPAPLGSFAAGRSLATAPRLSARRAYPPLPVGADGIATMTLTEYVERGAFDTSASLVKTPVRLEGFVMPDDKGSSDFLLTRFQVACCAADGQATQIRIVGLAVPVPERDAWVRVVGRMVPADASTMRVEQMDVIPRPDDPYEEA